MPTENITEIRNTFKYRLAAAKTAACPYPPHPTFAREGKGGKKRKQNSGRIIFQFYYDFRFDFTGEGLTLCTRLKP